MLNHAKCLNSNIQSPSYETDTLTLPSHDLKFVHFNLKSNNNNNKKYEQIAQNSTITLQSTFVLLLKNNNNITSKPPTTDCRPPKRRFIRSASMESTVLVLQSQRLCYMLFNIEHSV